VRNVVSGNVDLDKDNKEISLRIPVSFQMYGQTYHVAYNESLLHSEDARGLAHYRANRIILQPSGSHNPIPETHVEHSFCHEFMHHLFHAAGYEEDRADEIKVNHLSHLLHQALSTFTYAPDHSEFKADDPIAFFNVLNTASKSKKGSASK